VVAFFGRGTDPKRRRTSKAAEDHAGAPTAATVGTRSEAVDASPAGEPSEKAAKSVAVASGADVAGRRIPEATGRGVAEAVVDGKGRKSTRKRKSVADADPMPEPVIAVAPGNCQFPCPVRR